jgi:hypothetical protein
MQRRLLIIALVFVAGFGVGYGITWLIVGSPKRDETRPAEALPTAAPTAPPATLATSQADASPARDASEAGADAGTSTAGPDVVTADTGPGPETTAASAPDAPAAEPLAKAAWEACHMHVCRLDFGKVSGGISIREGRLEHGQAVDWDRDFAKADKIGTLEAGNDVQVEVLAIGLANGEPAAAYIVRKAKRNEVKGVIALRIGDKQLSLVPISE